MSETIARSSLSKALSKVDLPTLGSPTIVTGIPFLITEWTSHVMRGLPKEKVIIQLELIDAEGKVIEGPFNNVTRTITLKE